MDIRYFPMLVLRSAAGTAEQFQLSAKHILSDYKFVGALYLANPAFYNELEKKNFAANALSEKQNITLSKYYNRYCFRPTPFGAFAGIATVTWSDMVEGHSSTATGDRLSLMPDQGFVEVLSEDLCNIELLTTGLWWSNPTLYLKDKTYRFIYHSVHEDGKRDYLLQSVPVNSLLKLVVRRSINGANYNELINLIISDTSCNIHEAKDFLQFLCKNQLLINDQAPNVTNGDYLSRLANLTTTIHHLARLNKLDSIMGQMAHLKRPSVPDLKNLSASMTDLLGNYNGTLFNAILVNQAADAILPAAYRTALNETLDASSRLVKSNIPAELQTFKKNFYRKFEGQSLPLLVALDPETGLGYEEHFVPTPTGMSPENDTDQKINWTPAHRSLLNAWQNYTLDKGVKVISLDEIDLPQKPNDAYCLGYTAIFRTYGKRVFLESAGGTNEAALIGRFGPACPKVAQATIEMANHSEKLNNNILFAELLHLTDTKIDNVNRRQHGWSYEIPITATSTKPKAYQIELSDLSVFMQSGQLWLWSSKHRKVVVPRHTSAYNHARNRLPLFRFLCDLSYQYTAANRNFDLSALFPGLNAYPRVMFKGNLLGLASWVLNKQQCSDLSSGALESRIETFQILAASINLPDRFCLGHGDQQLFFNRRKPEEVVFFLQCIKKYATIRLIEHPENLSNDQYNAFMLPNKELTAPVHGPDIKPEKKLRRQYAPGSNWLYFKIYSASATANSILLKMLQILVHYNATGQLSKWYYLRYADPDPHIRIRLQIDPRSAITLLAELNKVYENSLKEYVIREYQLDVYRRELERYKVGGIEATEAIFWRSSELTLFFLRAELKADSSGLTMFAFRVTADTLQLWFPNDNVRKDFCTVCYDNFSSEFPTESDPHQLDKRYRNLRGSLAENLTDPYFYTGKGLAAKAEAHFSELRKIIFGRRHMAARNQYVASIIHMQINRLFEREARRQEMEIYYLLAKYYAQRIARQRRQAAPAEGGNNSS